MNELRNLREISNFTCKDMAEKLKMSMTYYWQIENKKRRLSYETAVKTADIFKTTPDKIFYKEFKSKDNN